MTPAERQAGQSVAYRFLGRTFYEAPNQTWLKTLSVERLFELWPFPANNEHTTAALATLRAFCEQCDPGKLSELTWDFNRLFVGPGQMLAPPWESVHRSKQGLTFQETTIRVRQLYEQYGLRSPALHREPDDHIGLELTFLAELLSLAADAAGRGRDSELARYVTAQREFLENHLMKWAPEFLRQIEAAAETDYYRGVARLTLGCLTESTALCAIGSDVRSPPSTSRQA